MNSEYIVVGGGLLGLATAWQLQKLRPDASLLLLEKEAHVALHQSGRNSGVIHAGIYYEPGSLKARLCREGLAATYAFCAEHGVPHARCGKLVVATSPAEVERLRVLAARAAHNAVTLRWLEAPDLAEVEPSIVGMAAVQVPETGMVDYPAMAQALLGQLQAGGAQVVCGEEVTAVREYADRVEVETPGGAHRARHLVVCAGLYGDRLARAAGLELDFALVPFRGDYFRLPPARDALIRHHIYPVPDPALPFLGIHLTRLVGGGIAVGPSAMLAFAREGYRPGQIKLADLGEMCRFGGLWKLLARHAGAGLRELGCAVSKALYLREVRRYCPELSLADLLPHPSGVRAQAVSRQGVLLHDFLLRETARSTFVCNAPSPAATAALPIGAEIVRRVLRS